MTTLEETPAPTLPSGPDTHPEGLDELGMAMGTVVGRYVILRRLGAGGMGVVWVAYDPELDRKVALKVLRPRGFDDVDAKAQRRLLREAQAMARLSHPNVVAVHDVGEVDGRVYVAMELIAGASLGAWGKQDGLTIGDRLDRIRQAGHGLAAAHASALIHRDFKPDNVMVGDDGRVRVLDFGLARATEDKADGEEEEEIPDRIDTLSARITRAGSVMGTPAYMSPEQHLGLEADARSDQFSFCVTAWELLYGERPFHGVTRAKLAIAVAEGEVRPAPRETKVPARVHQALLRGLARMPEDRWPSMDALLTELVPPTRSKSRPMLVTAAAAGFLGVALVGMNQQQDAAPPPPCQDAESRIADAWSPERKAAVEQAFSATALPYAQRVTASTSEVLDHYAQQWTETYTDACEATQVRGDQSEALLDLRMGCLRRRERELRTLVDALAEADPALLDRAVGAVRGLSPISTCSDAEALQAPVPPPEDPQARAEVDAIGGELASARALELAGHYEHGLEIVEAASERARPLDHPPTRADVAYQHGRLLERAGRFDEAERALGEAIQRGSAGHHDALVADAWKRLVFVIGIRQRRHTEALALGRAARAAIQRTGGDEGELAGLDSTLGSIHDRNGEPERALELHRRALATRESLPDVEDTELVANLNALGAALEHADRAKDAVEAYERSFALLEARVGDGHPYLAVSHNNLANAYDTVGDTAKAREHFEAAIRIQEGRLGPDHPDLAITLANFGILVEDAGDLDQAEALYRRALTIQEEALGPDHPAVSSSLLNLGMLAAKREDPAQAREHLDRALAIRKTVFGEEHPAVAAVQEELDALGE